MESIAKALILAVQYIDNRNEETSLDDDARTLEEAASILRDATPYEKETLIKCAHELGLPEWPEQIGIQ